MRSNRQSPLPALVLDPMELWEQKWGDSNAMQHLFGAPFKAVQRKKKCATMNNHSLPTKTGPSNPSFTRRCSSSSPLSLRLN